MAKISSLRYTSEEYEEKQKLFLASLHVPVRDPSLYHLSGIHRSVLNLNLAGYTVSNERLEFLWDAILEFVITKRLFHDFPDYAEWKMTDIRSALVRWRNLALIAKWLHMSDIIQLSRGELLAEWQDNPYILANTFEAFLGALYLDLGFDFVEKFILDHVYSTLDHILDQGLYVDPKSFLQEFTQAKWGQTPLYRLEGESWQDHNKIYAVSVSLDTVVLGFGSGSSKKKAEQEAAENAIAQKSTWENAIALDLKENG